MKKLIEGSLGIGLAVFILFIVGKAILPPMVEWLKPVLVNMNVATDFLSGKLFVLILVVILFAGLAIYGGIKYPGGGVVWFTRAAAVLIFAVVAVVILIGPERTIERVEAGWGGEGTILNPNYTADNSEEDENNNAAGNFNVNETEAELAFITKQKKAEVLDPEKVISQRVVIPANGEGPLEIPKVEGRTCDVNSLSDELLPYITRNDNDEMIVISSSYSEELPIHFWFYPEYQDCDQSRDYLMALNAFQ